MKLNLNTCKTMLLKGVKMLCEMCGSKESVLKAVIEGTEMYVCIGCSRFGKVINEVKKPFVKAKKTAKIMAETKEELVRIIVPNYSQLIRDKRENLGLSQKDFAKKINEKESLVHNIEISRFEPSIKIAEKIEKFLCIKLIEEYIEKKEPSKERKSDAFTIGDLIKVKK